jgi:chromosome segregation ATPase
MEAKAESQSKIAKMRILTMEASIADLKRNAEDLRTRIVELETALEAKQGEVDDGLGRESLMSKEIDSLKAMISQQKARMMSLQEEHREAVAVKNSQLEVLQVLELAPRMPFWNDCSFCMRVNHTVKLQR